MRQMYGIKSSQKISTRFVTGMSWRPSRLPISARVARCGSVNGTRAGKCERKILFFRNQVFILKEKLAVHHAGDVRQEAGHLRIFHGNAPSYWAFLFSVFQFFDSTGNESSRHGVQGSGEGCQRPRQAAKLSYDILSLTAAEIADLGNAPAVAIAPYLLETKQTSVPS
jgi:hypothetical protein